MEDGLEDSGFVCPDEDEKAENSLDESGKGDGMTYNAETESVNSNSAVSKASSIRFSRCATTRLDSDLLRITCYIK